LLDEERQRAPHEEAGRPDDDQGQEGAEERAGERVAREERVERGRDPLEGGDPVRYEEGEGSDPELAPPVPPERGADAVREAAQDRRAGAEPEEVRGDDGGGRDRGAAPRVREPLEPDDLVGERRRARDEEQGAGEENDRAPGGSGPRVPRAG
jgi:hypothetical protein